MNYYYLISGLPNLYFGNYRTKIDTYEVLDTIKRNLNDSDLQCFQFLLYPFDNQNLINAVAKKFKGHQPFAYHDLGNIEVNILEEYHRNTAFLPSYMSEFINSWEEHFPTLLLWEIEEKLSYHFYTALEELKCTFISEYYAFEESINRLVSAYNTSYYPSATKYFPTDLKQLANQVGKGKTPPSSFLKDYFFLEALDEVFAQENPLKTEQLIDKLKWDFADNVEGHFEAEVVYAFTIKLLIFQRWSKRDEEEGQQRFEQITEKIKRIISTSELTSI